MQMAIDYKTSPYIVMAIHGYHPFTPDAGILCGGYQSPIYPHPTTFEQPTLDSAILSANDRRASAYSMKVADDFYEGLGKWNPSINWYNPGHLLGIFDTLNRMGYGLAVLKEIKAGSIIAPEEIFNPIIVKIPFKTADDLLTEEFTLDDIYALGFSEKPMLYIPSFVDEDGNLILDPRIDPDFDFTGAHTPAVVDDATSIAGMQTIFQDKDSSSYLYMRQPLVDIHTELSAFAAQNINGVSLIGLSVENLSHAGNTRSDIPRMPLTEELFNGLNSHETSPASDDYPGDFLVPSMRHFYNNFTTLTQAEATKVLTGFEQFHTAGQIAGGPVDLEVLEHRTLTELNSVVNLVPVQTYGITFGNFFNYDFTDWVLVEVLPQTYISWLICDIILTSNVAQTVNITGAATAERTASDGTSVWERFFTVRNFATATSHTRDFTWNRSWWDLPLSNVKTSSEIEEKTTNTQSWVNLFNGHFQDPGEFGIHFLPLPYVVKDEFNINESIVLDGTGETVRVRIILQSQTVGNGFTNPEVLESILTGYEILDYHGLPDAHVPQYVWGPVPVENRNGGDDLTIDIAVDGETMNFIHTSVLPGLPGV